MITVILRGGLGNQMFQYASGLGIAKKNGTTLALDSTYLNDRSPRGNFTRRNYDLDIFETDPDRTLLSKISAKFPLPVVWLGADFFGAIAGDFLGIRKFFRERTDFAFDQETFNAGQSAILWGFWQNEKYFDGAKDEVRAAFRFKKSNNEAFLEAKKNILAVNAISLHVRRGDYTLPKYLKVYGATDTSYYDRAIAYISERVDSPHFFVFSDDIDWCRNNIKTSAPVTYMDDATAGRKASGHLELISLCKHNIIANSTFSWWGAWLNQSPGKIVVAPKRWHADLTKGDLISEQWIKI